MNIYEKGNDSSLKKDNLVCSTSMAVDPRSKEKNYSITVHKDGINKTENLSILGNISTYLNDYFVLEETNKLKEEREQIVIQRIIENEVEEDPDDILEQLRAMEE